MSNPIEQVEDKLVALASIAGRIFKGDNVKHFLDWFEELEVGIAVPAEE